jgi:NADPH-dependent 2,4-dienoyl-CoA reductase/sulfur reductase-like enzyme
VGGNECITRRYTEGLPFGCAVNPHTSREVDAPWPTVRRPRRLLVVGGGPAGMELAALARENGFAVDLWEAEEGLGGQLRYVVKAPRHEGYAKYLQWQTDRLDSLGVKVELGRRVTVADIRAAGADTVAIATGAAPRRPVVLGVDGDHVLDIRDVLAGGVEAGQRVLVVAQDDHVAPLSVADFLARQGREVAMVYATHQPAPLLSRYIIGAILGRLDEKDVKFHFMEEVVGINRHTVNVRNVYSWRTRTLGDFDSVVLACGSTSESSLYDKLRTELPDIHILGDAYAPRRIVFATRQAYALAEQLVTEAAR